MKNSAKMKPSEQADIRTKRKHHSAEVKAFLKRRYLYHDKSAERR